MINYETPTLPFSALQKVIRVVSDLCFDIIFLRNRLVEIGYRTVFFDNFYELFKSHNFYHAIPWCDKRLYCSDLKAVDPFIIDSIAQEIDENIEQIEDELKKNLILLKDVKQSYIKVSAYKIDYTNETIMMCVTLMTDFVDKYNRFIESIEYLSDFIYSHNFK